MGLRACGGAVPASALAVGCSADAGAPAEVAGADASAGAGEDAAAVLGAAGGASAAGVGAGAVSAAAGAGAGAGAGVAGTGAGAAGAAAGGAAGAEAAGADTLGSGAGAGRDTAGAGAGASAALIAGGGGGIDFDASLDGLAPAEETTLRAGALGFGAGPSSAAGTPRSASADWPSSAFLAAAFFGGGFLVEMTVSAAPAPSAPEAAGSTAGCLIKPSRLALRRRRSACASTTLEE